MNKSQQNSPASTRLLNKLRIETGLKTSSCTLSTAKAMNLIENVQYGVDIEDDLRSYGAFGTVSKKYKQKVG